jgi:hypothetical protein
MGNKVTLKATFLNDTVQQKKTVICYNQAVF